MSCLGGVCWNKHAMGVRRVCVSVAVAFSHLVKHVVCGCVCVAMDACVYRFAAAGDRGSQGTCQMCVRGCGAPILTCWNES
jgi:hypothetical protein